MMREYQETDWILIKDGNFHVWGCRACNVALSCHWEPPAYKFCPFCGAERIHKNEKED